MPKIPLEFVYDENRGGCGDLEIRYEPVGGNSLIAVVSRESYQDDPLSAVTVTLDTMWEIKNPPKSLLDKLRRRLANKLYA